MKLHLKSSLIALALGLAVSGSSFAADLTPPPAPPGADQHDFKPGEHPEGAKPHGDRGDRPNGDRSQPGKPRGGLEEKLNLDKDQSKALRHSMREDVSEQRAIVGSYLKKLPKPEQDAMAAELKASHDKHFKDFLDTLTPEQQAKAKDLFAKFKTEHPHGKPGADGKPGEVPAAKPLTH
ncbi:hypothetical protein IFT69_14450 [Pseudomonas putida]|nr:hypothetical protein [Pseudomonas putida]